MIYVGPAHPEDRAMLGSNSSVGWGPKLHGGAFGPRRPFDGEANEHFPLCAALDLQAL